MRSHRWLSVALRVVLAGACPLCLAGPASGQQPAGTTADPAAFWNSLVGKQLILRDYAGDAELGYGWDGNALNPAVSHFRSLTSIRPTAIHLDSDGLWLQGTRYLLLKTPEDEFRLDPVETPVELNVRWKKGTAAPTQALLDLLFFHSSQEAIDGLPLPERGFFPLRSDRLDASHPLSADVKKTCDAQIVPPKLVKSVDPSSPKDLRRAKGSTLVQVLIEIDTSGVARNAWIARPSAFADANASAAKAVLRYRFRPANCRGDFIPVQLFVDISYSLH